MSIQSKHSEIKNYALCLSNASKDFAINNMTKKKKKNTIKKSFKFFSFDLNPIDTNNILDIYGYFIKRA